MRISSSVAGCTRPNFCLNFLRIQENTSFRNLISVNGTDLGRSLLENHRKINVTL